MSKHTSKALGRHLPNGGEGLTVQQLYEALRVMTFTERNRSYITVGGVDVIGLSIGQSDQAQRGELKVSLLLEKAKEDILWEGTLTALLPVNPSLPSD